MIKPKLFGIAVLSICSVLIGLRVLSLVAIHFVETYSSYKNPVWAIAFLSTCLLAGISFLYVGYQLWIVEQRARTFGMILYGVTVVVRFVGIYYGDYLGKPLVFQPIRDFFTFGCMVAFLYLALPSTKRLFQRSASNGVK